MTRDAARNLVRRLVWLVTCIGVGGIIGAIGAGMTGSMLWYLAIPVAVAVGWLVVADPSSCAPAAGTPGKHDGR